MNNTSSSEAFEALKEYMRINFNAKIVSNGKEILKRCHFCGDSKDPTNAHLYIGLKDGLIKYNCFKCNARGIVDAKFLRDLECYDHGLINLCLEQNKKILDSQKIKYGSLENTHFLRNMVIPISTNEFAMKKLDYISNRMGHVFTAMDATRFKIILNLKEFLCANNIARYTRHPDLMEFIDKYFVGFLSMDNQYVILRRLVPEGKLPKQIDSRYLNYKIFWDSENGMKQYTIPGFIDPAKPIDIHIAEGCFDILSIYLHVAPIGGNAIYSAIAGNSYKNLVKFFIMNYGFMRFNLHLYPDSDVAFKQMIYTKNAVAPFDAKCFVHRNTSPGQKDYGVRMDQIVDNITPI